MRTKLGWGESDKGNVLGLVEALLAIGEGELELDDSELKTAVQVKWESACKLRVTGKIKRKTGKREQTVEVGTTLKDLVKLVEKFGKSLELPKRQRGAGRSKEEREADAVQNVIDYLKALGVLDENDKNPGKNKGYRKFTFTLKHQTATLEENCRWIEQKWNEHTQQNSPSQATSNSETEEGINWHHVCRKMLEKQRETLRRAITGRHLGHEAKNVYVKLGLVKPKEQPRRGNEFQPSADRGTLQYQLTEKEIEQKYQYDEFLEQVIEGKEKNFTIVGEPGAGKSTWLEQIALYVDNSNKGFPLCISLASLGGKTLEEYLFQSWLKNALLISQCDVSIASAQKKLEELFKSGKVWLLLDGVDEMRAEESPLQAIATQLEGWGDLARVVLTCRSNVWEANPNTLLNFETYRTLHFDDEQVGDFIQQWFTQEGKPELGEELETKLDESRNDRIRDLIKNPLRLAMLCGIWYFHQGDLPKTKATLYQQYIEYFYRWKRHPQLTDDLDKQEELHTAFSKLALKAIDKKLSLRKKFARKEMGKSLFQLARDVGWLNWVYKDAETGEDVYAFFHLTFQEYFAACAIDDWRYFLNHDNENPNPLLNPNPSLEYDDGKPGYRIFEPQWKEVILLWLGREDVPLKQKQEFLTALVNFDDGCWDLYRYQAWFLAAMGTAESREFREFKNFFFECDPNEAHEGAIEPNDTGYSLTELVVMLLVRWSCGYFNEEDQQWRRFPTALEQAAEAALLETDRSLAVAALTEHYLSNLHLGIEPNWRTRWRVAELLVKIAPSNKKTHTTLKHFILKCPSFEGRFLSLWTLEKIAPDYIEAHPGLCEATTELYPQMAEQLIKSLLKARNNFECLGLNWDLRSMELNSSKQLTALIDLIRSCDDWQTLRLTSEMLEQMNPKDPKTSSILINLCSSDNETIRRISASALGKLYPNYPKAMTIALDTLIQLIRTSDDESIHQDAVESIRQILQNHQLEPTVSALKNSMQNLVIQNDARRHEAFYSIILYCAYNLPYRGFYQAWHQTTI
jgi:hypothetical protein